MPKTKSVYVCQQCGYRSSQYLGRCPQCDSWNSLVEEVESTSSHSAKGFAGLRGPKAQVINLQDIKQVNYKRLTTKMEEFDRVLGGGVVAGSLVLVSGDPGIGKSTLLTQLALNINQSSVVRHQSSDKDKKILTAGSEATPKAGEAILKADDSHVLYVAGEESAQQIKLRVDRISPKENLAVLNEVDVDLIVDAIRQTKPALVIVDSIQTLQTQDLESVAGSVGQVRESAHRLQRLAKDLHIPIFLVGHVTKEGNLAGPKTLEHVVDVVLSLEGDPASLFRILRSTKNRFGPTDEVGVFEMEDKGMIEVKNPSKLFLDQKVDAPGSSVSCILTGIRPLLVEIQALVTKTSLPMPRRTGSGIDNNRLQLLVAVLQKRMGLPLYDQDIFVNVTGGLRVFEPAADLGICMAIISSFGDNTIKPKTVFVGEVGLLGEVRTVREMERREKEGRKLGFTTIITPKTVKNLSQAVKVALLGVAK